MGGMLYLLTKPGSSVARVNDNIIIFIAHAILNGKKFYFNKIYIESRISPRETCVVDNLEHF